jgi:hypothetical protein
MAFNWFKKTSAAQSEHAKALAQLFLKNLRTADQGTVRQYIKTEFDMGLTLKDAETFCLRYPHIAQEIIQHNVDIKKVVKKK